MIGLPEIIIGGLGAIGGGFLTEFFRWIVSRRSEKINDASKLIESATTVVKSYDQLVEDLREQVTHQKMQISDLQDQVLQDRVDIGILQSENERLARQIERLERDYQEIKREYEKCQAALVRRPEGQNGRST